MTLQYFFNQRTDFGYRVEDGQIKKLGEIGGKEVYVFLNY